MAAGSGDPQHPGYVCLVRLCCWDCWLEGQALGAAVADDNRGEVDVVGLITHSEGRTQSLLLSDAATLSASALTSPHFHFLETVAILSEEYANMTPNYFSNFSNNNF